MEIGPTMLMEPVIDARDVPELVQEPRLAHELVFDVVQPFIKPGPPSQSRGDSKFKSCAMLWKAQEICISGRPHLMGYAYDWETLERHLLLSLLGMSSVHNPIY